MKINFTPIKLYSNNCPSNNKTVFRGYENYTDCFSNSLNYDDDKERIYGANCDYYGELVEDILLSQKGYNQKLKREQAENHYLLNSIIGDDDDESDDFIERFTY